MQTPDPSPPSSNTARKPLFDTVRALLKRGFRQSEVDRIDRAMDRAMDRAIDRAFESAAKNLENDECSPAKPGATSRISVGPKPRIGAIGIALIKRFEGCARLRRDGLVEAYPDPGTGSEPWTIGWGATGSGLEPGSRIGPGTVWTQDQCDARLADDLARFAREVAQAIGDTPTSQAQFDAMVSFHYNTGAIARATLTKLHVAGDYEGAAAEFKRWNQAGGRVLKGLVRRRAEEEQLYRSG